MPEHDSQTSSSTSSATKVCIDCLQAYPLTSFYFRAQRNEYLGRCHACLKVHKHKQYRATHPKKPLSFQKPPNNALSAMKKNH